MQTSLPTEQTDYVFPTVNNPQLILNITFSMFRKSVTCVQHPHQGGYSSL